MATKAKAKETTTTKGPEEVFLSASDILEADDLTTDKVYIKDWGGFVRIKLMDAKSAENWGRQAGEKGATAVSNAIALVRGCAVNPDGSKMFPTKESIERLAAKSMRGIRKVSDACIKLNGLGDGRRAELAELLRTRAEDEELEASVVAVLMDLASELDGQTMEEAAKNA